MYDADALEAINAEQLVTPTDRLLLRGGQMSRRRRSARSFATGSQPHIVIEQFGQGSQPDIAIARFAQGSHPTPPSRVAQPYLEYVTKPRAPSSQPEQHIAVAVEPASARPARRSNAQRERTAIIRRAGAPGAQMLAMTVVIPALVGIVVGLAALL